MFRTGVAFKGNGFFGQVHKPPNGSGAVRVTGAFRALFEQPEHGYIFLADDTECAVMPIGAGLCNYLKTYTANGRDHIREIAFQNYIVGI